MSNMENRINGPRRRFYRSILVKGISFPRKQLESPKKGLRIDF